MSSIILYIKYFRNLKDSVPNRRTEKFTLTAHTIFKKTCLVHTERFCPPVQNKLKHKSPKQKLWEKNHYLIKVQIKIIK